MIKDIVPIIVKELSPVVKQALALEIKTQEDMPGAVTLLSQLNKFNDRIVAEKERITKPLLEALKVERSRWKPAELQNEEAIETVREKMTVFQTREFEKQKKAEAKIASKLSEGKITLEKAVEKFEKINTVEKNVSTTSGDVQFVETKKFEVMDIVLLGAVENGKYLLPNESMIRESMKAGVELSGVRYYTEMVPRNYR